MKFLALLTQHIVDNYQSDYQHLAIVLPNKRAQQNLYSELAQRIEKPAFAPAIFSMDEFVRSLSPLRPIETSEQLVELFQVYRQSDFGKDESFQAFNKWGRAFLKDIDEIDLYAKNAEQIFANLADIKKLDFFGTPELTANEKKYLEFYYHLKDLYTLFKQHLTAKNQGFTGMIYRDAAENISQYAVNFKYEKIIFAGLNALTPTEQNIAKFFHERGRLEFLFDMDHFYFDNEKLKIGERVKEIQNNLGIKEIRQLSNDYTTIEKKIKICGASQSIGQVYAAIEAIQALSADEKARTAVVFADETLLVPFIHAYPFNGECENITMSYPAQHSHAAHLLQSLLAAAQTLRRLGIFSDNETATQRAGYYHKDLLPLLQNPIIRQYAFNSWKEHDKAISKFLNKNHPFLNRQEITDILGIEFPNLTTEGTDFIDQLIRFLQTITEKIDTKVTKNQEENIERAILARINQELENVKDILRGFTDIPLDFYTTQLFITEQVNGLGLPFLGNPAQGLQIMGLLETRTLDFDNVIMVGTNEGIIPAGKNSNSMLLYEIKSYYGLPTYEHNDTIFAYHFFRLLQRAQNILLIYNTDNSSNSSSANEESRFIRQLEYEVKHQHLTEKIDISRTTVSVQPHFSTQQRHISIEKTPEVIEKLKNFKYSTSSLSIYINCPLQFYLKKIAKIEPEQEINENIEKNVIGNVIHKVLEDMARAIRTQPTQNGTIFNQWKTELEKSEKIQELFWENDAVKGQDLSHGKLLLAVEIVRRQLFRYFDEWKKELDNQELAIRIIEPEMELSHEISVNKTALKLIGKADLVEIRDGKTTILDYKTGQIHNLIYTDTATLFSDTNNHQLMQLLMYAYLYWKDKKGKPKNLRCAIVSFQSMMANQEWIHIPKRVVTARTKEELPISTELLKAYEKELKELFKKIMNPQKSFTQTDNDENCKYCDYRGICRR